MSRQVVDAWFDAFRTRDIEKLELTEDFAHTSPFGVIRGREAYLEMVRANEEAFFTPEIEILDVMECGGKYAVRYLVDGNPACDCIYVRDGQISEIFAYYHVGEKPDLYSTW